MSQGRLFSYGALVVLAALMAVVLIAPLCQLVLVSLSGDGRQVTVANYEQLLNSRYFIISLAATIGFCGATSLVAVALALPAAWRIGRRGRGYVALRVFCQVNYAFGSIVFGMLMLVLLGNAGLMLLLEEAIIGSASTRGFVYTGSGLALAYFGFQIPRSALVLAQAVEKLDPHLIRAARTLGANDVQVATLVIIPALLPSLSAAFLLTFLMSIGSFGIALLISKQIPIFSVLIYREFTGFANFETAAAMSIVLCLVVLIAVAAMRRAHPSLELFTSQPR